MRRRATPSPSAHPRHHSLHLRDPRGRGAAPAHLDHDILQLIDELALVDQQPERASHEEKVVAARHQQQGVQRLPTAAPAVHDAA